MIRLFGLRICTRKQYHHEVAEAFDLGRACGRISIKAELGMLPVDDVDRLRADFGPASRSNVPTCHIARRHLRLVRR